MGNADKTARDTARFLDNLTEFITGEDQQLDEIMDSLRAQGVDPEESLRQFRQTLSEHAPTWREKPPARGQTWLHPLNHRKREHIGPGQRLSAKFARRWNPCGRWVRLSKRGPIIGILRKLGTRIWSLYLKTFSSSGLCC